MSSRFRYAVTIVFILAFFLSQASLAKNLSSKARPLNITKLKHIMPKDFPASFRTADTCAVYEGGDPAFMTYPWVEGDELFKAYQNPAAVCENPYPFSIDRIHVIFYVVGAGTIVLSGDIEAVDNSVPSCPHPGAMLTLTDGYQYEIPGEDLYFITIPLDSPIVVNEPYFVGLYVASDGNPTSIAVVTDDTPVGCVSYNDWGNGYVDLDTVYTDPDGTGMIKTFAGRMILYSSGILGGSSGGDTEPEPAANFISPTAGQFVGQSVDLWANDAAGSTIIEKADFYYSTGGSWTYIGSDLSDDPPLRNSSTTSGSGNGLSFRWYPSGLQEGIYQIHTIITDTLGRSDTAQVSVYVDPTPPFPVIAQPTTGMDICDGIQTIVTVPDEDIGYLTFETKSIPSSIVLSIPAINQNLGGDTNSNPSDGNTVANGENGDYCSGPAAAAMAVKYWANNGYSAITQEGISALTDIQLMERFYTGMNISDNMGAFDEEFVSGLNQYLLAHGGGFDVVVNRDPLLKNMYNLAFNDEYILMAGISGNPGRWLTISGMTGMTLPDSQTIFKFVDPAYAAAADYYVKEEFGKLWVQYFGQWYEIDLLVGLIPSNWMVSRTSIGFDGSNTDGWGFFWNTSALDKSNYYYLQTNAFDNSSHSGSAAVLIETSCTGNSFLAGDVNGDGNVNPGDLVFLINYIYLNDTPPPAGMGAANINDDALVDLRDVIYLYRFLFLGGPAPI